MFDRRTARIATTLLVAAGVAVAAAAPANAGTPHGKAVRPAGGGGEAFWFDYDPTMNNKDTDDIVIEDFRDDSHGVWVRVEHPDGRYTKVNNEGPGNTNKVTLTLPNLEKGEGISVTVCLSEKSKPITSTCSKPAWFTE